MASPTSNLPGSDMAADERVFSEAESTVIADLVLWHRMPHLSARELLQLSAKRWSVWSPNNIQRISDARRQDQTRDWYFPIFLCSWSGYHGEFAPPERCYKWAGMWHPMAEVVCPKLRPLPPMTCMLQDWQHAIFPLCEIVASAGGLLLIKARTEVLTVPSSSRTKTAPSWPSSRGHGYSNDLRSSTTSAPWGPSRPPLGKSSDRGVDWIRLLVCNPLTRQYRELPEAKCAEMGWKSWQHVYRQEVQIHMDLEDKVNWYQVILILQNFLAVYKSTTDSWNCMRFQASRPWSVGHRPWMYHGTTPRVAGRLYAADIESAYDIGNAEDHALGQPVRVATLRLFEVDTEAGRWMPVHQYALNWFNLHPSNPFANNLHIPLRFQVEVVGCMGSLYAVIPSWLHNALTVRETQISRGDVDLPPCNECETRETRYKCMSVVFNVMKLEADGEVTALLQLLGPSQVIESVKRSSGVDFKILNCLCDSYARTYQFCWGYNSFTCTAVGSVIWVLYRQSLFSYDVVSGKYSLQNMQKDRTHESMSHTAGCSDWSPFSYRPNFHIKP